MSPSSTMSGRGDNKLKAFFRSRSHPPNPSDAMHRHLHKESLDNPPSSYAKSSVRSQNRPISSTTTATHSTITPLPSDSLRYRFNAGRHAYASQPHSTDSHTFLGDRDDDDSDDHHFPRSETPSSTKRKLLLHSFFGISLTRRSSSSTSTPQQSTSTSDRNGSFSTSTSTSEPTSKSSRKRSFRLTSRPTTPKSVDDASSSKSPYFIPVPSGPLPLSASPRRRSFGLGSSQRSTPKSSTSNLPLPHAHSPHSGRSHGRRHSVGSERPPHDSAVALSEEPSHRYTHKGGLTLPDGGARNKGKERQNLFLDSEGPLRPSIDFPSQSLPIDPSPISRNYLSSHFPGHPISSHLPTVDSASSEENDQSASLTSLHLPVIPRIIHTPPTPQRPGGEVDSPSRPSTSPPVVNSTKVEIPRAKAVTIAHREQVLVTSSQSHTDPQHTPSSKRRFTPRFFSGKDLPKIKDTNGQKASRRPSAASDGKASGSNVTSLVRNMTSHRSKLGSFDFERPISAFNRSSSTVDRQGPHVPKGNSSYSNARFHSLERTISEDSARCGEPHVIAHHAGQADSSMLSQTKPFHTGDTSVVSFSSVSVQTMPSAKGTGSNIPAGQTSSWGRASSRRVLGTSHGTFAFEQPSSVPSSPNPQNPHLPVRPNQNEGHMLGLPQSQPTAPSHTVFDARMKHSRGQSHNTSDHAEPGRAKPGERKSQGKGRSLDLGLGLSWAPSRVREEVLMPGFILAREKAKLEKMRATGSDVTKVFESILSESRFQTFKEYVHRFDAHIIPLEGPSGLLARVEKLLAESGLCERERNKLVSDFTIFVENHGG